MNVTTQVPWLRKLPSWAYKGLAQSWIDVRFPRHLFIETTAACNLTCSFCPRERRGDHMAWELFTRVCDEAALYGPRSFSLHLFGEPLLYPRWFDAIRYIKQCNRGNTVLLTTNGTKLNKEVDRLIEANPDQVLWSWRLEAKFTPETKEKLRKWGKFRVRFIDEVTPPEARKEWENWPNVEGRKMHNYGGLIDTSRYQNSTSLSDAKSASTTLTEDSKQRWPCYHLWLAPAVAWNGNILLCCADSHHKEVLGTFPKDTVASIWQGKQLASVRESHLKGEYKGICEKCDVWKSFPDLFFQWQKRSSG